MELNGFSMNDMGFSKSEDQNFKRNTSLDKDLNNLGKDKIEAIIKAISEINQMILEREKLRDQIVEEGEKLKYEINNHLSENERMQMGGLDVIREKNDLRHKKVEISEMQLNERINCWKDVALLKKELRENERELSEKQGRMSMLNNLMGDY